jgi:hypothetical protein
VPRMKIINGTEQMLFDRPPQMSGVERRRVFELPSPFGPPPINTVRARQDRLSCQRWLFQVPRTAQP